MKTIWQSTVLLLAPCFCRGAYQDTPEIRVSSIRGMVRWWFRALGGSALDEKRAFGGMKEFAEGENGKVAASHLVFRLLAQDTRTANPRPATLPHKNGGQASPQAAFADGGSFLLEVTSRCAPLAPELERQVVSAIDVWVLLGSLGLRANRAGGSLWPAKDAPRTPAEFRARLDRLGCRWPAYLSGPEIGHDLERLRAAATDTLGGEPDVFGSASPRQASTVKMKIVLLEGNLRLLITAPDRAPLEAAKRLLRNKRAQSDSWLSL